MNPPMLHQPCSLRAGGNARGQSFVEFALVLPILLTLLGAAMDAARLYQAWITLESATRNAAEYAATNDGSAAAALNDASRLVCLETNGSPGFTAPSGTPWACTAPTVAVTSFSLSTTDPGASIAHPLVSVTVSTTLPFRTLFPYPLLTQSGAWTLTSNKSFSLLQGR